MPARLKIAVAYDGTHFAGWQSQAGGNTIQDFLERAVAGVIREPVRVYGAGRTDAGVHALAQSAHFELPARTLTPVQWLAALNTELPATIRVLRCSYVGPGFHARFSAKGKVYRYRIRTERVLPPLEYGRAWHVPSPLDVDAMSRAAAAFQGRHDFASFAANRGKAPQSTVRTIDKVRLRRGGHGITVEISGDGFLYKMVRLMVGALVRIGRGQDGEKEVRERLVTPVVHRAYTAARFVAPACGLFLVRVRY